MLTKCKENYIPHKEQAIDEAMVSSKGRRGLKQYLPAKPTKFGIKVRECANSCNGYRGEFQVYIGHECGRPEQGLVARVVTYPTRTLGDNNHDVCIDIYFSSIVLFEESEVVCCGIVHTNRRAAVARVYIFIPFAEPSYF